jgi:protein PhnA
MALLACSQLRAPASFSASLESKTVTMTKPACPACTLEDVLSHPDHWECAICGHEWPKEAAPEAARIVKDAHGNVLVEGDTVVLVKDLKLGGGSQVLKAGTKAKNIRLVEGDHEIACKIDGSSMALKACFVKKG